LSTARSVVAARAFLKAAPDLIAGDMDLRQFAMISKKSSPRA
jgi:hypothetical protein